MTQIHQALLTPIIYYDLLERPLTATEIFKYLRAGGPEISFFGVRQQLKAAAGIRQQNGLYFLSDRQTLIKVRQKRLKLSQLKWKKLKAIGRYLSLAPFLRLAAVTGSLTANNARLASDLDLLIVLKKNRLWLGRLLLTGLIALLGQRRHGQLTRDRLCLNCYLTEEHLEISVDTKPRDWHAAQEYGRLFPLLETQDGLYEKFIRQNSWLADFLKNYPWPNGLGAKKIKPSIAFSWIRRGLEWLLGGWVGEKAEKITAQWQKKRIHKKRRNEQPTKDQIFVSDNCLMFHPQSKSDKLMKAYKANIIRMTSK